MNAVRDTARVLCQNFSPEIVNGIQSSVLITVRNGQGRRDSFPPNRTKIDKYEYMKILLDLGIDPFDRDRKDVLKTPLVKFAEAGDITALRILLEAAEGKGGFSLDELSFAANRAREIGRKRAARLLDRVFYRTMYPVPQDADGDDVDAHAKADSTSGSELHRVDSIFHVYMTSTSDSGSEARSE